MGSERYPAEDDTSTVGEFDATHELDMNATDSEAQSADFGLTPLQPSGTRPADEFLYQQIYDAILGQRLRPGKKLTEESLAAIFGVGRTVVRRALLRLSYDRVVVIRPNRGATVANPSVQDAREVFSARRLIETELTRDATELARPDDLQRLRTLVRQQWQSVEAEQRGEAMKLCGEFHFAVARLSGHAMLAGVIASLVPLTSLIVAQSDRGSTLFPSWDDQNAIIDSMEREAAEAAGDLMKEYLSRLEASLELDELDDTIDLDTVFSHVSPGR